MKIIELIESLDEALRFSNPSPRAFVDSRGKSAKSAFLTPIRPQELTKHTLSVAHGGQTGYAMDKEKDLQNVFNVSKMKGVGKQSIIDAVKNGAVTLDAFDGFLPRLYQKYGFFVTGRTPFVDEFAPENWDYAKYGRPDVVFMVYRGGPRETIERRVGLFPPYQPGEGKSFPSYDEAKRSQRMEALKTRRLDAMRPRRG